MKPPSIPCENCLGSDCPTCNGSGKLEFFDFLWLSVKAREAENRALDAEIRAANLEIRLQQIEAYLALGIHETARCLVKA